MKSEWSKISSPEWSKFSILQTSLLSVVKKNVISELHFVFMSTCVCAVHGRCAALLLFKKKFCSTQYFLRNTVIILNITKACYMETSAHVTGLESRFDYTLVGVRGIHFTIFKKQERESMTSVTAWLPGSNVTTHTWIVWCTGCCHFLFLDTSESSMLMCFALLDFTVVISPYSQKQLHRENTVVLWRQSCISGRREIRVGG